MTSTPVGAVTSPAPTENLRTWQLDLPFTKPLTANDRYGHHMQKARITKQWRTTACLLAKSKKIPALARIAVEVHYAPRTRAIRDAENLAPTTKVVTDGIRDAGVVPDDDSRYVQPTMPILDDATGKPGRLYVIVRELPAVTP